MHRLVAAFVQHRLGDDQTEEHVERTIWDLLSRRMYSDTSLVRATWLLNRISGWSPIGRSSKATSRPT